MHEVEASDLPQWVRPVVACALLGIGTTTLYNWFKEGRLVTRKVGGVRLISAASIACIGQPDQSKAAA